MVAVKLYLGLKSRRNGAYHLDSRCHNDCNTGCSVSHVQPKRPRGWAVSTPEVQTLQSDIPAVVRFCMSSALCLSPHTKSSSLVLQRGQSRPPRSGQTEGVTDQFCSVHNVTLHMRHKGSWTSLVATGGTVALRQPRTVHLRASTNTLI